MFFTHTVRIAFVLCICISNLGTSAHLRAQAYQQLQPPPNVLPNSIGDLAPPVWSPNRAGTPFQTTIVPPNSLTPPKAPSSSYFESVGDEVDDFEAFSLSVDEKLQLRPWKTFDIPIGSWGDKNTWDPEQLNSTTIERFRKSFVQKVQLNGGYVWRDKDEDLGYSYASAEATMVVPLGSTDNLLVFTPRYRVDWIEGPKSLDVPSRLQSVGIDIAWRRVFNPKWSTIVAVRPSYFNDFDADSKGERMGGLAIVNYAMIPKQLTFTFGVVYLDRNDTSLLPAVGMTWLPNANTRLDLNFPKPKIAKRISHLPFILEDWVYVGASFGGSTWAVRRSNGRDDELTLRDYRVSLGYERILNGGTGYFVDVGYVFGRELEYEVGGERRAFGDSFVVEAGLSF